MAIRGNAGDAPRETAAWWFARLRADNVSIAERTRFQTWLADDPAHAAAYHDFESLWGGLQAFAADDEILDMRRQALALAPEPNRFRWERLAALAATATLALALGVFLFLQRPNFASNASLTTAEGEVRGPGVYRTGVGQNSRITLADGSIVELNTASTIQVNFSGARRDVRLLRGQALFQVAPNPARPFVVEAGGQRITAVGTAFEVRLRREQTVVVLVEGEVDVDRVPTTAQAHSAPPRRMRAGEQLVAATGQPFIVQQADVARALSWRSGRVIFSDEPLSAVVEEVNRYSERKVILGDPTLSDLRISGVFRAGSIDNFVTALDAAFPIDSRSDESSNAIVLTWD
jgi:transmembrane sensor